jgi:hypothetical protein
VRRRVLVVAAVLAISSACSLAYPLDGFDDVKRAPPSAQADGAAPGKFGPVEILAKGERGANSVAMDAEAVYWVAAGPHSADDRLLEGEVVRFGRAPGSERKTLQAAIDNAHALAADEAALYWVEGTRGGTGIGSVGKDGFGRSHVDHGYYALRDVALDATTEYVLGAFGELSRAPKSGGAATPLRDMDPDKKAIVVDNEWVYLAGRSQILRVAKADGQTATFASSPGDPSDLVVDDRSVFWTTDPAGKIMKLDRDKPGSTPIELASGQLNPAGIAVSADDVYWTNSGDGTVRTLPRSGGSPIVVAEGQSKPKAIAADANAVAWINEGDGSVVLVRIRR